MNLHFVNASNHFFRPRPRRLRRLRRQEGGYVLIALVLFIGVAVFMLIHAGMIAQTTVNESARKQRLRVQAQSFSEATYPDLEVAAQNAVRKLAAAVQVTAAQRGGAGAGDLTPTELDQICRRQFPKYFPLELRGATIAPTGHDEGADANWGGVYGRATLIVNYDGVRTLAALGLPPDPNLSGSVVQVTVTVPYEIQLLRNPLPEDGDETGVLGSAWRPAKSVSTDGGRPGELPTDYLHQPLFATPTYAARGEFKAYVALARRQISDPNPQPDVFPYDDSCPTAGDQATTSCAGFDADNNCTTYVVQQGCTTYQGTFNSQGAAQLAADAVNTGNSGEVYRTLKQLLDEHSFTPVAHSSRNVYEGPNGYHFQPAETEVRFNGLFRQMPGSGTYVPGYGGVPARRDGQPVLPLTSSAYNVKIKFTRMVQLPESNVVF